MDDDDGPHGNTCVDRWLAFPVDRSWHPGVDNRSQSSWRLKIKFMPRKGKLVKKTTTTLIKKQPTKRRTAKRRIRRSRKMRTIKIPAAQGVRIPRSSFRRVSSKNNEQEIILEGEDLIIPTPDALPTNATSWPIFLSIPANPLYWKGTRVSGIAAVYQQYRPLKFEVEYVPQVPVTCPGQVIYGTLYNKGVSKEAFQQTLMTSNGGGMTQCYLKSHSHVICNKKTLPLTLYNTFDSMNENVANPFNWVAHYSGQWSGQGTATTSQPGWVWVKWRYLFSVGLGSQSGEVIVYNQTDAAMAASNNFFAGWGVALNYLKNVATKLLTKIAIVLLEETEVQVKAGQRQLSSKLGIGSTFSVEPESISDSASNDAKVIRVRDDAGNEFDIPEDVRVVIYQNGDSYEVQPDPIPQFEADYLSIGYYRKEDQVVGTTMYNRFPLTFVAKTADGMSFTNDGHGVVITIALYSDGIFGDVDRPIYKIEVAYRGASLYTDLFVIKSSDGELLYFPVNRPAVVQGKQLLIYEYVNDAHEPATVPSAYEMYTTESADVNASLPQQIEYFGY